MSYHAAVLADNPIAYWRLGETSGDAIDSVGGVHAVYTGTPTQGAPGLLVGDADKAVTFASGDNAKANPVAGLDGLTEFTLECLVKLANVTPNKCFISVNTGATDPAVLFSDSGTDFFLQIHTVDGAQNCGVAGQFAAGTVYHVVGRYKAGKASLWVNGVKVQEVTITGGAVTAPAPVDQVWIGRATFGYPMVGTEDEVAVYDYGISDARIVAHYTESQTPSGDNNDIFDQQQPFLAEPGPFLDEIGTFVPGGFIG